MMSRLVFFFVLIQTLWAAANPAGEFLVGGSEGDDFHHILRLQSDKAIVREFTTDGASARTLTLDVKPLGKDQYELSGEDNGEPVRGYLHFTSDDEALVWFSGHTRLYWALRTTSADLSELQGKWSALATKDIWDVEIKDNRFEILRQGEKSAWSLHPVSNHSAQIRIVARPDKSTDLDHNDSYLLNLIPLGDDRWLVRNHEKDHFLILFRENSRSMMEAELQLRMKHAESELDQEDD